MTEPFAEDLQLTLFFLFAALLFGRIDRGGIVLQLPVLFDGFVDGEGVIVEFVPT